LISKTGIYTAVGWNQGIFIRKWEDIVETYLEYRYLNEGNGGSKHGGIA
jgi:hypothetical protein